MYTKFYEFGISDKTIISLSEMGFEEPTPIQKMAIPHILQGSDIIGQAQTGTGKTAAFGIPLIEQRSENKRKNPFALILAPTRELVVQVSQEIMKIGAKSNIVCLAIYGGQLIILQIKGLKRGVDIVVGTPGRILDHLKRGTLVLKEIKTLVLDEADEMLNMGFIDDIEKIIAQTSQERQTILFSATMPKEIISISKKYMKKPILVRVNAGEIVVTKIKQIFYEVNRADKIKALSRLLNVEAPALTLVFCHTKREVDEVCLQLQQMNYSVGAIHGDFTQNHRTDIMGKFRGGEISILVATDVAARGLDIPDVSHVINFSIPQDPDGYVHRVGRTGRAGKSGIAITFVTPREYRQLRLIEQFTNVRIKRALLPTKEQVEKAKEEGLENQLEEIISKKKHTAFYSLAKRLGGKYPPDDVIAATLSMLIEIDESQEIDANYDKQDKNTVRLFMTIGKKDNIKIGDIVKSISAEAGIPAKKISNIALLETFSFIEVPTELADKVVLAINNSIIKGKKIKIEPAKKRQT